MSASLPGRSKSGWLQGCASPAPPSPFPPRLWVVSWTFFPPALSSGTPASPLPYRGCEIMQPGLADRKGQQLFSCPQADAQHTGASCLSLLGGRESGMGPQLYPQTPEQSTRSLSTSAQYSGEAGRSSNRSYPATFLGCRKSNLQIVYLQKVLFGCGR